MPEEAVGATPAVETPPAPVADAGVAAPAPQSTGPDAGGTGVDPLIGRLRAAGISANDLEQVERYYGGHSEVKGLRGRVGELEGVDTLSSYADKLMQAVDPDLREQYEAYRALHGDTTFVEALHEDRARGKGEAPDETDDARIRRIVRTEHALLEKPRLEREQQAERQSIFDRDLEKILGGMTLKAGLKDWLRKDVPKSAPETIANAVELADYVQARHQEISGLAASETQAVTPAPKPVVPELPSPPGGEDGGGGSDSPLMSIKEVMDQAVKAAEGSEAGAGAR